MKQLKETEQYHIEDPDVSLALFLSVWLCGHSTLCRNVYPVLNPAQCSFHHLLHFEMFYHSEEGTGLHEW